MSFSIHKLCLLLVTTSALGFADEIDFSLTSRGWFGSATTELNDRSDAEFAGIRPGRSIGRDHSGRFTLPRPGQGRGDHNHRHTFNHVDFPLPTDAGGSTSNSGILTGSVEPQPGELFDVRPPQDFPFSNPAASGSSDPTFNDVLLTLPGPHTDNPRVPEFLPDMIGHGKDPVSGPDLITAEPLSVFLLGTMILTVVVLFRRRLGVPVRSVE